MAIAKIYKGSQELENVVRIYKGSELLWEKQTTVDIVFKQYTGAVIQTNKLNIGDNVIPPSEPTRTNYLFVGWVRESDSNNVIINFNTYEVAQPETFVPLWIASNIKSTNSQFQYSPFNVPVKYTGSSNAITTQNHYYICTKTGPVFKNQGSNIQALATIVIANSTTTTPTSWTSMATLKTSSGITRHTLQGRKAARSGGMYRGEWQDTTVGNSGYGPSSSTYEDYSWQWEKFIEEDLVLTTLNSTYFVCGVFSYNLTDVTNSINTYAIR